MNDIYYTYVYCDPRKKGIWKTDAFTFFYEPFYVGQGKRDRYLTHLKCRDKSYKSNKIRAIKTSNLEPIILKVIDEVSEIESLDKENLLIMQIGAKFNIPFVIEGPLTNMKLNKRESNILSEEIRIKIANGRKGKRHTLETRAKISAMMKNLEHHKRANVTAASKGRKFSDSAKSNMSNARKGNQASSRNYIITFDDCKIDPVKVFNLTKWCIENSIPLSSLRRTLSDNKSYKGIKLSYDLSFSR